MIFCERPLLAESCRSPIFDNHQCRYTFIVFFVLCIHANSIPSTSRHYHVKPNSSTVMKTILQLLGLLTLTTLLNCNHTHPKENNYTQQEEEIKTVLTDMWEAIEKEDIQHYASFIHPDFTQFGETDPTLNIGKEVEINGVREWIESSSNIHTEMEEPRVVVKGDVAWVVYYWNDRGTTNGELFASRGKSTRIFVKEDGKWLCIHGHYTLLP